MCGSNAPPAYRRGSRLLQEEYEIRHVLWGEAGLEAFGHEGEAGAGEGFDLGSFDGVGGAVGTEDSEAGGGLVDEQAGEVAAVGRADAVGDVAAVHGGGGFEEARQ